MLQDDAFLRRLPDTLDPGQALRFQALVFASDLVFASYNDIVGISTAYGSKILDQLAPAHRVSLFSRAWTIVDNLHVALQLFRSLGLVAYNEVAEFCEKYETATLLRNKMDHLDALVGNLVRAKKATPIFGSLSYILVTPEQLVQSANGPDITACNVVTLLAGSLRNGQQAMIVNPASYAISGPVCVFQFQAFDQILNLENAVSDLAALLPETNKRVEQRMREQLTPHAAELGMPIEKLLAHSGADLNLMCTFVPNRVTVEAPVRTSDPKA